MQKETIILFGASTLGIKAYNNLKNIYDVIYFCDNDSNKWGSYIDEVKIISPKELVQYKQVKILIASMYVNEISKQLVSLGIDNYEIFEPYNRIKSEFENSELQKYCYNNIHNNYKCLDSRSNFIKKVLFVQSIPDIRTYKIAKVLSKKGIMIDIAYLYKSPLEVYLDLDNPYNKIIKIDDIKQFIQYINKSDYDVIHSSNEPDFLTSLLLTSNKSVIHDCHDMSSLYGQIFDTDIVHEFVSNKLSDGNIYVDYPIKNIATEKFGLESKPIFLLNNYVLKDQLPKNYINKLSEEDGEIHCVYEGGLSSDYTNFRYLEDKFKLITDEKIHIHFYTISSNEYFKELDEKSPYLHWEGILSPNKLIAEMTKYDVGLVLLNVNKKNVDFLSTTFPNKLWEYIAAGLPVVTENLPILEKFISDTRLGEIIYDEKNISYYISRAKSNKVGNDFLIRNKLLMDDFADYLISFYSKVKENKFRTV